MFPFTLVPAISPDRIDIDLQNILLKKPQPEESRDALRKCISFMDLTTLEGSDHPDRIQTLCRKAISFGEIGLPVPAAVCIYPPFIAVAKEALRGTAIRVATTAAAFPSGQMPLSIKLEEIRYAIHEGADEIDVVISRGTLLEGKYEIVFQELEAMRKLAGSQTLKVILETGELQTAENIAKASEIAILAGADFIKTSTGKINPAATPGAVFIMLQIIREYFLKTGIKIGIKPAGGISEPDHALTYYWLVSEVLGPEWLTPGLFRIGASRLADKIVEFIS